MKYVIYIAVFFSVFQLSFAQSQKKPNVVFIILDDLNDYTGFLGGHTQVKTPHMDALAAEGVVFENAHTNAPICAPSRASLFTGIYPHVSKNYWFSEWYDNPVLQNNKTLMQFMRDNGYDAFGTGKLMHHRVKTEWTEYGIDGYFGPYPHDGSKVVGHPSVPLPYRDIDKNDGLFSPLSDVPKIEKTDEVRGYDGWKNTKTGRKFNYVNDNDRDLLNDEESANWAVAKINALATASVEKPFFMAVGFVKPHTPLVAPKKYFDMYPLENIVLPTYQENDKNDTHYRSTFTKFIPPWAQHYEKLAASFQTIDEGMKKYLQAYLACVSFADAQVGKVISALNNSKFKDNTIVILTSDHGYNLGEKEFLYKNNLWEETTRIPLVIKHPGIINSSNTKVDHPVSLIDIYPTIADLCGINASNVKNSSGAPLDGFSLKPFLEGQPSDWLGPDVALTTGRALTSDLKIESHNYSVRSEQFRYIWYTNGKEELYDHSNDEYEWVNLAENPNYAEVKAEMKRKLNDLWMGKHMSVATESHAIQIAYNPSTKYLYKKTEQPSNFVLYNVHGNAVLKSDKASLVSNINVTSLPHGVYVFSVKFSNNKYESRQLLIY